MIAWHDLEAHLKEWLETARDELETPAHDPYRTESIRGRIATIREIFALANPTQPAEKVGVERSLYGS